MLYSYEEWTDPETDEVLIQGRVVDRRSYRHLHSLLDCMEFSGQCGNSVSHGMAVFWSIIYCGY